MSDPVVHVIDDDVAVRQSLAFLLATAGLAVRLYDSALGFLDHLGDVTGGCIVTDVRMPDIDGLELLRRVKAVGCSAPVIVMTGHADVALAVQAMKDGAMDFVEKPFDDTRLIDMVRTALERVATQASDHPETAARLASLSDRERQVLDGILEGKANKVIAYDLGLSARTVEVYRANLMSKMGVDSVAELVRKAILAEDRAPRSQRRSG